ncbi:Lrp/AsnC family transcriptional regulator [Gordonia sp. X0973]|uniref:Lrp/AsnC family transcriptional regulator n=1 Tax=Gordonia sp. X0973 TaxID=2742602 RepID=UPI000F51AF78|nr:Lrp/AsnC family transcriptional regulator [Gordonia sp. X0973]QKT06631.1 Lrp/AsnC family transcriptional regulator [Gordonia sp. X0973]
MDRSVPDIFSNLDLLDTQIVAAIQISPRASFREIAEALGEPEHTVSRRYRRLRREGLLRVTLALDPRAFGGAIKLVRLRCRPEAADAIALSLARRDDVSWVSIHSAGWEIVFNLRAKTSEDASDLLTRMLPRTPQVLDVRTATVLHQFAGGSPHDWHHWQGTLTASQIQSLAATNLFRQPESPSEGRLPGTEDRAIIEHLTRDGRLPFTTLARNLDTTTGKVTRRVEQLVSSGVAYFDVDVAQAATGGVLAAIWMNVAPAKLDAAGQSLGRNPTVPFAAAISGTWNLSATVMAADHDSFYGFITTTLATIDGITGYEFFALHRRIKNAGALVAGDRLAMPSATPRLDPPDTATTRPIRLSDAVR